MKHDLAIIIVNYRTPAMTIECLTSLMSVLPDISVSIIIVDNDSGDDSVNIISQWCEVNDVNSVVRVIGSSKNLGFSGGNNLGIKSVKADFYLLLNSDTLVKKNALELLMEAAIADPKVGLVTPGLENIDGEKQISCFQSISPISEFVSAANTGPLSKLFSKYIVPIPVINNISSPIWSSFACVLVKKEVFDAIGLLDDGFFMYFEDAEYCYRAKQNGWKTINIPSSHVIHLGGKSSSFKDDTHFRKRLPRYYYEARARYFYKLYGRIGLVVANLCWWAGRLVSKLRQISGNTDKAAIEMQWIDIWINWLHPLKPYTHPDKKYKG